MTVFDGAEVGARTVTEPSPAGSGDDAPAVLAERLGRLRRDGPVSLAVQLVDLFVEAIHSGELAPGEKLPPTRRLAELAGVNQLTASRCYRRLAEMGAVVSHVGRGTFVRSSLDGHERNGSRDPHDGHGHEDANWQAYALPAAGRHETSAVLGELARHANAPDVIAMSAGYPAPAMIPLADLEAATACVIERNGTRAFNYEPVEGVSEYRAAIARLGQSRGLLDGPEAIVAATGTRQALTLAARAILRPGDKVACESPTFMGIIDVLRATGAELLPVPVDEHGLDIDALEQLLRRHEIRLVATQPRLQNPTGRDLSAARRERLAELARWHAFFILEDAVYADLRFSGDDLGPLRPLAPAHVVYVDSFSKTVGPGLRAGWIAASGPVLDRVIAEKASDDAHSATLTQLVTAEYLDRGLYPGQLERARVAYAERCDAMLGALDAEMGEIASYERPAGGHHIWLTLHEALDDQLLYRSALAAGVTFVPGAAMLVERPRETCMRLSFGLLSPDEIREGVRRLAGVVHALRDSGAATRQSAPIT